MMRRNNNKREPIGRIQSTPVFVRPDHRVVVKYIGTFQETNANTGYFDSYDFIKPYDILIKSPYKPLLDIYDQMRVTKIVAKCWLGNVSINTVGYTAAMLYKDVIQTNPNRFAEQLILEPGSKRNRPHHAFTFTWLPVEPMDYEFYSHPEFAQMDSKRYGQLNFAGSALENLTIEKPVVEYIVHYDFKSLFKPVVATNFTYTSDDMLDTEVLSHNSARMTDSQISVLSTVLSKLKTTK